MSAGNEIELTGMVSSGIFSEGSKSEHEGVYLVTDDGTYTLRRKGGNPFNDPELTGLLGKQIKAKGVLTDYLFLMSEYSVV